MTARVGVWDWAGLTIWLVPGITPGVSMMIGVEISLVITIVGDTNNVGPSPSGAGVTARVKISTRVEEPGLFVISGGMAETVPGSGVLSGRLVSRPTGLIGVGSGA